jgi:hypothetical protein
MTLLNGLAKALFYEICLTFVYSILCQIRGEVPLDCVSSCQRQNFITILRAANTMKKQVRNKLNRRNISLRFFLNKWDFKCPS